MGFNDIVNSVDTVSGGLLDDLGLASSNQPTNIDKDSGTAPSTVSGMYRDLISKKKIAPKIWYTEGSDWYKVFGYRFSIAYIQPGKPGANIDNSLNILKSSAQTGKSPGSGSPFSPANLLGAAKQAVGSGDETTPVKWFHFTLPIPPQQLVSKPIIPSKVTATLGGVVEETSQVKFWINSMSGTTGTSMSRLAEDVYKREKMASKYRDVIETTGLLAGAAAGLNQAFNKIGDVVNTAAGAAQAFASGDFAGGVGGVTGAINNALTPPIPYSKSGVDNRTNGFVEAQELQKFFFMYSALKARYPKNFALLFTNFKTDQSWRCIVKDFQLQQSAENPYLFKYNINLQCWDIRRSRDMFAGTDAAEPFDRFGAGGDLAPVNTLSSTQMLGAFSSFGNALMNPNII